MIKYGDLQPINVIETTDDLDDEHTKQKISSLKETIEAQTDATSDSSKQDSNVQ